MSTAHARTTDTPRQLGDYLIEGKLGEGGMGAVYRARHATQGHTVALKVLYPHLAAEATFARRFMTEGAAPARVGHPGVVQVSEHGRLPDGTLFLAMELIHGESLRARLARAGRLDAHAVVAIGHEVAAILAAAHARGIVHRDLKPDNIMLEADPSRPGHERVRLLDFGIARVVQETRGAAGDTSLTHTGEVLGTPCYMAPEQCRGERSIDGAADVYALGAVLYELLAGVRPFNGSTIAELIVMHLSATPRLLREIDPEIPAGLATLVQLMLDKSPDERPSAQIVCDELAPLVHQHTTRWGWEAPAVSPRIEASPENLRAMLSSLWASLRTASLRTKASFAFIAVASIGSGIGVLGHELVLSGGSLASKGGRLFGALFTLFASSFFVLLVAPLAQYARDEVESYWRSRYSTHTLSALAQRLGLVVLEGDPGFNLCDATYGLLRPTQVSALLAGRPGGRRTEFRMHVSGRENNATLSVTVACDLPEFEIVPAYGDTRVPTLPARSFGSAELDRNFRIYSERPHVGAALASAVSLLVDVAHVRIVATKNVLQIPLSGLGSYSLPVLFERAELILFVLQSIGKVFDDLPPGGIVREHAPSVEADVKALALRMKLTQSDARQPVCAARVTSHEAWSDLDKHSPLLGIVLLVLVLGALILSMEPRLDRFCLLLPGIGSLVGVCFTFWRIYQTPDVSPCPPFGEHELRRCASCGADFGARDAGVLPCPYCGGLSVRMNAHSGETREAQRVRCREGGFILPRAAFGFLVGGVLAAALWGLAALAHSGP